MAIDILKIVPSTVELGPGETQAFEALEANDKPAPGVKWTLASRKKEALASEDRGVYSAPAYIFRARKLSIVARQFDASNNEIARGSAVIELDATRSWIPLMGAGWLALFATLLVVLLLNWTTFCPQCTPPGLLVSPPVVTLGPGQAQQFIANAEVTWTNTVNGAGLYIAPSAINDEQTVTVTATSRSDPRQSASGVVRLSRTAGFSVVPSHAVVDEGRSVQLTASMAPGNPGPLTWLHPVVGNVSPAGLYTAPANTSPRAVVVLAQAQPPGNATPTLLAGALLAVVKTTPDPCAAPQSPLWRLILLVAWVGALGGLTHAMGSFGTYVGNRELKASWLWWYALKPALSAAVAVLVYLVFRAGIGAPDLGLNTSECLTVAGFAGLVGLFAEPATLKLRDIFEAIFTPRRDPREDRAGQTTPTAPQIDAMAPDQFKASDGVVLTISGKNFADNCIVRIGTATDSKTFTPERRSATSLAITIAKDTLTPATHDVVVVNNPPNGAQSSPRKLKVERQT